MEQQFFSLTQAIRIGPLRPLGRVDALPKLRTTFLTANQKAGLDWPVRVLVYQAEDGSVYASYTDFDWIANACVMVRARVAAV